MMAMVPLTVCQNRVQIQYMYVYDAITHRWLDEWRAQASKYAVGVGQQLQYNINNYYYY